MASTPLATHFRLLASFPPQTKEEVGLMSCIPYDSVVDSLIYAIVCTRSDIPYSATVVTRYIGYLEKTHL